MKKFFSFILLASFVSACAGNPPAWWNPNNRYGTADGAQPRQTTNVKAVALQEETLELPDSSYEEITLTPMPDEENENKTGASSAQNEEENLPLPSVLD